MTVLFPCPCCGFLVFAEPAGSYEICPLCNWEDDAIQLVSPGYAGGANKESLCTAQRRGGWATFERDLFRGYRRALGWRPLRDQECRHEDAGAIGKASEGAGYYWDASRPAI